MGYIHKAVLNGYTGYYNSSTGRVKFNDRVYPSIEVAVKYLAKQ
jgi:hypothetical protein